MDPKQVDRRGLTQEQVAQLDQWENSQKQLQTMGDVASMVHELINMLGDGEKSTKDMGSLLLDMRETLSAIRDKENPEAPDVSKPIVEAVDKLDRNLGKALAALKLDPQIRVDAPSVKVDAPNVTMDLKPLETLLEALPKDLRAVINALPKPEKPDNSDVIAVLTSLDAKLADIDIAVRLKPLPGSMSILVGGSAVSSTNKLPVDATFSGTVTSAPTYKDDPTDSGESPKFGKTNSSTHKQEVEADVGSTITSLPLPSGASTSAKQLPDNHNVVVTSAPTTPVTGTFWQATQPVSAATLPLPTGASTAASQTTTNSSLSSIDTKTPALGQALAAASSPVVLTAAQITTLTPQTNALTDTQLRASTVPVSLTSTTITGTSDENIKQVNGATVNVGTGTAGSGTQRVSVSSDSFPTTQAISAASLPLPTGASTAANQSTGNSSLSSIDTKLSGTIMVDDTGPTALVAFVTAVTTAGTRVQLASNAIEGAVLQAPSTNTGIIYVGASNVSSTVYGAELQPGQATGLAIDNANKVWIDASVNGDKCALLGG